MVSSAVSSSPDVIASVVPDELVLPTALVLVLVLVVVVSVGLDSASTAGPQAASRPNRTEAMTTGEGSNTGASVAAQEKFARDVGAHRGGRAESVQGGAEKSRSCPDAGRLGHIAKEPELEAPAQQPDDRGDRVVEASGLRARTGCSFAQSRIASNTSVLVQSNSSRRPSARSATHSSSPASVNLPS